MQRITTEDTAKDWRTQRMQPKAKPEGKAEARADCETRTTLVEFAERNPNLPSGVRQ